jgi:1-acyl-sn-glycerol-3-phosphate acyltransferase
MPEQTDPTAISTPERAAYAQTDQKETFVYRLAVLTTTLFSRFWLRIEIKHVDRVPLTGPVLILATHTSFFDPPIVGAHIPRPCHYLAREGILKAPLLGALVTRLNTHPIRRGAGDREAIRTCREILRQGWPLVFFPEGTRSPDGRLGPIQGGFAMILDGLTGVPYVPVLAQDTYAVLRRGWFFPRPRKVRITYGEPAYMPARRQGEKARDYFERCGRELESRLRELGAR